MEERAASRPGQREGKEFAHETEVDVLFGPREMEEEPP
jgi:hypothetical protein